MVDGRTDGYVITIFCLIYRLSGAPLQAPRARDSSVTNTYTDTKYHLFKTRLSNKPSFSGEKML